MGGVDVTAGVLVMLGAVMVVLGLFGGAHLGVIALGLVAIMAAGTLQIAAARHA